MPGLSATESAEEGSDEAHAYGKHASILSDRAFPCQVLSLSRPTKQRPSSQVTSDETNQAQPIKGTTIVNAIIPGGIPGEIDRRRPDTPAASGTAPEK